MSIFKLKNKAFSVPETVYMGSNSTAEFSASCPGDVAKLFSKYFLPILTANNNANDSSTPSLIMPNENFLSKLFFSPNDILVALLLNQSHVDGSLPEEWKLANIPLFKKGDQHYVENCHPFSSSVLFPEHKSSSVVC